VSGINLEVIGQREELLVDAVVELARVFSRAARKVRPSHGTDEQGVSRKHEPRLIAPPAIGHNQADALGRVCGRVQQLHQRGAELELLAVALWGVGLCVLLFASARRLEQGGEL